MQRTWFSYFVGIPLFAANIEYGKTKEQPTFSMEFISKHPFYIPFICLNIWLVYKVIKEALDTSDDNDKGDDEDDRDNGLPINSPDLDLPPGVSLPVNEKAEVLR